MNNRGISPVIATVIIVAVAIAIAIAVAFWMTGIVGLFTGFEQVKVISAYASWENGHWNVTVTLKNTGTADATIDEIFLNGKPYSYWDSINGNLNVIIEVTGSAGNFTGHESDLASMGGSGVPLPAGDQATIILTIPGPGGGGTPLFNHGQSLEVKVHTASGQEYPKLTTLP